ncbi:hypothetical protein M885DRAFT_128499 [Pelagophyceae sp. CCMP2097]|nr:hypothetical protein M885DRAFT_128499 [Pelagophyceae sp. CCMP2097]
MRAGADGAPPETALYCWGAGAQRYAQIAAVLDDGAPAPRAPAAALFAVSRRSAVAAGGDHLASEPAPPEGARADAALRRGAVITVGAAEDHVFAATRHRILAWHKDAYQSDTLKWLRGAIVLQIACGDAFALARTDHLEVFAWGTWRGIRSNSLLEPGGARRVDGLVGVAVSCVAAGPAHAVAVSRGGGAFSWGGNEALQCGTRRTENFLWRPTAVCRSALVAGETFAASGASCGARHTLLPTTRGRVVACGDNGAKQCGGAGAVVHPPAAVDGVDDAVATAGGDEHSAVVRRDGSVVELRSGAHAAPHALVFGPGRCFATGVAAAGEVTFVLAAPTGGGAEVHEADDFELCLEVGDFDCLVRLRRVFESPSALAAAFMAPGGRPRGDLDGDDDAASLLSDSGSDVGSGSGADSDAAPAAVAAAGARSGGGAPAALLFEPREPWGLDGAAAGGARLAAPRSARSAALYVTAAARREAYFDARAVEDPGPRLVTQQAAILASIVRANVGARAVAERAARQQGNGPARPSEGQAERAAAAARTAAADGRRRRAAARARLRIEWDAASGDGPPPLVDFDGDSADDASMDADSMPELEETTDGGLDDSMPDLEELDDDLPDLEEDAPEARDAREARDHAPTEATPLVAPLRFTWPTLSSSASASSAETAQLAAAETVLGRSRSFDESIDDSMDEDVDEDCEFDDDDDEEDCYGDFDEDPRFIPEASSSSSSSEGDEEAAAAPAPRGAVPEDRLTDVLLGAAASAASGIEASLRAAAAAALGPVRSAVWPSFGFGLGAAPDAAAAAAGDDFDAVDLHAVELGRRRRGGGAVSRSFADVDDDADSSDDGSMPGLSPSSTTSERSRGSVAGLDPASPGGETAGRVGYSSGSSDRFGESAGAGVGYSSRRAVAARRHAGALPQLDSLESFSQGDLLVAGFEDDGDSPRAFDEDEDSLPALASASSTSSGEDDDEDDDDDDTEYEDDDDGNDEAFSLRFAVAPGGVDVRFARTRAPAGDAAGGGAALARPRARLRGRQARWKALRRLDCGRLEAVLLKIEGAKGTPWGCAAIKVLAAACRTCAGALETHATVNAAEWDEDVARCLVVLWASATLCDGTHVAPLLARHANAVEALVADAPPFAGAALGAGRGRTAVARIWRRSSVARCLSFAVGDCSSLRRRLREALAPLVYDAVEAASRDRVLPCGDGVDALQHAPRAAAHHHHRAGPDARAHAALTQRLVTLAHDAQRPGPAARVAAAAAGRRRASGSEALAVGYSAAAALELLHTVARCCGAGRDELDSFCLDCFDHLSGAAPRSKRLPPRDRFVWPEPEDDSDDDAPARPGGAPKGETAAAAPIDNSPEAASAAAAAVAHAYDAAAAQRLWPLRLTGVRPGGEAHSRVVSATSFDEEDAFGDAFVDGVQYRDTVDDAVFAGRGPARSALSLDFARWRAAGAPSGHLLGPDRWYFSAFACLLPRSARRLLVSVDERDRNWLGRARSGAGAAATRIPPFVSLLSASDFRIAGAARPAAARRPTHVAGRARGAGDAIAEDMFAAAAAAFAAAAFGADDSDDDALDDDAPDDDAPGDDAPGDDAEAPGDAAPSDDAALDDVRDWPAPALALASAGDLAPASYHHLLTAPRLSGRGHVEIDVAAASWPELLADLAPVRAAAPPPPPDVPPEAPPGAPRPLVLRHDAIVHRALLERRFGAAAETAVIEAATGFYLGAPLGEPAAAPVAAADGPAADGAGPTAADAVPRDVSADDASREVGGAAAAPVGAVPHLETLWAAPALRPADSARPAEVRPAASLELTLEEFLDEYTRRHQALLDDGAPAALPAAEAGAVPFAARRRRARRRSGARPASCCGTWWS